MEQMYRIGIKEALNIPMNTTNNNLLALLNRPSAETLGKNSFIQNYIKIQQK